MLLSALQMIITKMALAQYIFSATNQGTQPAIIGAFFSLLLYIERTLFFEWFPHVCPEPVLVKSSFLCIHGAKEQHIAVFACNAIFYALKTINFTKTGSGQTRHRES